VGTRFHSTAVGRSGVVGARRRDEGDARIGGDRLLDAVEGSGVGALRQVGDEEERAVEPGTEAVDEQLVGLPGRGVLGEVALVGEPEPQGEHRDGEDDEERRRPDRRDPRAVLDAPAPAVGHRLPQRLRRLAGHLALQGLGEEPRHEHEQCQRERDREGHDLQPHPDEPERHQAGGDEPPAAGELDPLAGEAEQRRQEGEGREHGDGHDRGGSPRRGPARSSRP
jgi:hypothetical protein